MSDNLTRPSLDQAINNAFSKLRDVSLRDGIQSWDGNKWPIGEILPVAKEINELVKIGKKRGIDMPSAEVWGGGQVVQPAMFMGEDPFRNLEDLHKAMPDTDIMALYRGRQGFGFTPISAEIQGKAIEASADKGVKVFRIFDMMNDIENVTPGINAMLEYKKKHGPDSIRIEGAISYISAPDKGERAMTLKEYGEYAAQLAKAGADEITIKNYAGVGDTEMPDLIKTIRASLVEAGHPAMKINLHDHGQKPETVVAALAAGADKVDVAIGALSGGPSHTNMRSTIFHMLEAEGIDVSTATAQTAINHHPMMRQLAKVESAIDAIANKTRTAENGQPTTFKKKRAVLEKFTQTDADHYRVAGGALSDTSGRIEAHYSKFGVDGGAPRGFPDKDAYFKMILDEARSLWEKAGQFNTVTPGAKNLLEQAQVAADQKIYGEKMTLDKYNDNYVDIAIGRYGENRGMDKGLGDTQWRDTMLMYRALKLVNKALGETVKNGDSESKRITDKELGLLTSMANLGSPGQEGRLTVKIRKDQDGKTFKSINLKDPDLEDKLNATDITRFRRAVEMAGFDNELTSRIMTELTPGRSPNPSEGLEAGKAKIENMKAQGTDIDALHASNHRISSADEAALLAMLLEPKTFGKIVDTVSKSGPVQVADTASGQDFSAAIKQGRNTGLNGAHTIQ